MQSNYYTHTMLASSPSDDNGVDMESEEMHQQPNIVSFRILENDSNYREIDSSIAQRYHMLTAPKHSVTNGMQLMNEGNQVISSVFTNLHSVQPPIVHGSSLPSIPVPVYEPVQYNLQGDHHEPTPSYANAVPHATTSSAYYGGPSHVSYNYQYDTTGTVQHCPSAAPSYHTPPTLPYPNITPSLYNNSLNLLSASTNFTPDYNEPDENSSNERPALVVPNCIPSNYESPRQLPHPAGDVFERIPRASPSVYYPRQEIIRCSLTNRELWNKFFSNMTEMIITRHGRRMFPVLQFSLTGLKPYSKYTVMVDMELCDSLQYKYSGGRWTSSSQADSQILKITRPYMHKDTPNTGTNLMKQDVSFAKLKLTNNKRSDDGQHLILSSMHKYQPRLIITPQEGSRQPQIFKFPETTFIAVTAYQNANITTLKVKYNPFAKGFRDNSDSGGRLAELQTAAIEQDRNRNHCNQQEKKHNRSFQLTPKTFQASHSIPSSILPHASTLYQLPYLQELSHPTYQSLPKHASGQSKGADYSPYPVKSFQAFTCNQGLTPPPPPRQSIKSWLKNVESNVHLQKSFEQIERDNETDYTSLAAAEPKKVIWSTLNVSTGKSWSNCYPPTTVPHTKEKDANQPQSSLPINEKKVVKKINTTLQSTGSSKIDTDESSRKDTDEDNSHSSSVSP